MGQKVHKKLAGRADIGIGLFICGSEAVFFVVTLRLMLVLVLVIRDGAALLRNISHGFNRLLRVRQALIVGQC